MGDIIQMVYIVEHGDTAWTKTGQHAGRRTCRCHLAARTQRVPSTCPPLLPGHADAFEVETAPASRGLCC